MEIKTLKEWMKEWGYKWVEGQERMIKSPFTYAEAQEVIYGYESEGAVKRG